MFLDNSFYHVYNRGNHKQQIFLQDRDYERFLVKAIKYQEKFDVKIVAYCLMPNHFHFLIQQLSANAISNFFSSLCNSQTKYFNIKYDTVGSLFQGRFKAKLVEKDEYLIHLSRYIHLNPIDLFPYLDKEKMQNMLSEYKWSSLVYFYDNKSSELAEPSIIFKYFSSKDPVCNYREFVNSGISLKEDPIINYLVFEE